MRKKFLSLICATLTIFSVPSYKAKENEVINNNSNKNLIIGYIKTLTLTASGAICFYRLPSILNFMQEKVETIQERNKMEKAIKSIPYIENNEIRNEMQYRDNLLFFHKAFERFKVDPDYNKLRYLLNYFCSQISNKYYYYNYKKDFFDILNSVLKDLRDIPMICKEINELYDLVSEEKRRWVQC